MHASWFSYRQNGNQRIQWGLSYFFVFIPKASKKNPWNINDVYSMFQILLSGVSQGSILRPLLFKTFINDMFYFIRSAQLLNFADDNTIATYSNSADDWITDLQTQSENSIDWFRYKEMVVNPDKFQCVIINRLEKLKNSYESLIDNHKIESENSVTLLSIEIDNKLN